jgi:Fe2+ or Zn2+ uptake regulation protein
MVEKTTRITRQRRAILGEMRRTKKHPTAWELFEVVRERLPRISLGTVYRNLERLCEEGLAVKLDIDEEAARYDAILKKHHHLKCEVCGGVLDVPVKIDRFMNEAIKECAEFEITDYSVDFTGVCPECREKRRINRVK